MSFKVLLAWPAYHGIVEGACKHRLSRMERAITVQASPLRYIRYPTSIRGSILKERENRETIRSSDPLTFLCGCEARQRPRLPERETLAAMWYFKIAVLSLIFAPANPASIAGYESGTQRDARAFRPFLGYVV